MGAMLDLAVGIGAGTEEKLQRLGPVPDDRNKVAEVVLFQGMERQFHIVGVILDQQDFHQVVQHRGSPPYSSITIIRRRMAYPIRSAWLPRLSLSITWARCVSTVRGLIPRRSAMAVLLWPNAARCSTSRSDRKSTRLNSSHHSISYAVF